MDNYADTAPDKIPQASAESRDSRGESAPEQRSLTPAQIVENGSVSSGGEDIPPLLGVDRVASSTPEPPASVGPSQPSLDEVNETEHRTDIAQPAGPGEIDETTPKAHKALGEEEDVVVQLVAAGRLSIADKPSKQALKRQRQRQKKENQNQHVVGATFSNATAVPSQAPKRASPATGSRQEEGMLLRPQIRPVNDEATPSVSENEPVETVKHSAAGDAPRLALTSRDADTLLEGAFKRTKHKKGAVNKADDKLTVSPGNHAEQKAVQEGVDQSILDDIPEKADGHVLMKPEAEEEPCHGMQSADVTADDVAPTTADHHTNDSEGFVVSELGEDDLGVGDSDEFVVRELAYSDIDDNYSHAMVDVGRGQNEEIDIEIGQEAVDSRAATEEPVEQLSIARATSPPPLTEEGIIQMGDLNDAGLELYIETQHKVCTATEEDLECRSQKSATVNLGRAGEEEVGEVFETVDLAPEAGATTNDDGVFESACDVTALIKHKALHIVPLTNEDVDGGEGERNTMNEVDVLEGANDAEAEAVATLEVLRVVSQPDEDVAAKNKPEVFAEEEVEALSAADHSEPLTEETENLITTNEPISMVEGDQLHAVNEGSESLAETEKAHINVSVREGVKKQTEALSTSDNSEGMTEVIDIPAACDRLQDPPVPEEAPAADQGHDVSTTGEKGVDLGKFAKEVVAPVEQGTKEQGEIGEAVITRQHSQEKRVEKLTVAGTEVPANEHVPVRKVMGSFIKPRTRSTEHERVSAEFNSSNTSALGTPTRSSHYSPQTSKVDRWAALGDRRRGFHPMSEDQARLNEAAAVHERSSEGSVEDLPVAACTTVVKEQTELQRVVDHKQKVSEAAKSSTQQDSGVSKQTIVREEPGATPKKMSWAEIVEEEEEEQRA